MYHQYKQTIMEFLCVLTLKIIFFPILILWWIIKAIYNACQDANYDDTFDNYCEYEDEWVEDEDNEQEISDELNKYSELPQLPEMAQVFVIDENTCIGVQYVSMCPDETAHIRVIGDTTFSQLYKRRVYRDGNKRYFKLNNKKYFLRNSVATRPIIPIQAKEGK